MHYGTETGCIIQVGTLKCPKAAKCVLSLLLQLGDLSDVWDADKAVDWTSLNFDQSWIKLRPKLDQTSSEVGSNFEQSWAEL